MYVKEGKSTGQIAKQLAADGVITRDGVPISPKRVCFFLRSSAACGEWHRHRIVNKTVVDPRLQRRFDAPCYMRRGHRPQEEWITIPIPAIIPRATWERVQGMMQAKRQPRGYAPSSLCLGVIFCGECGHRVGISRARRGKKVYRRYGCTARIYHMDKRYLCYKGPACDMPFFPVDQVDEQVWTRIEMFIDNPALLWEAMQSRPSQSGREALMQRRNELAQQLVQAKAREERAARLFTMGAAPQTAEKQVREATTRRKALELDLGQQEKAIRAEKGYQESKELAYELLMSLRGKLDSLTLEEKRRVLHRLVPGGLVHRLEMQADGSVDVNGIIDFDIEARAMSMPYSGVSYIK
jgi:site-specific DNA recombinase